MVFYDVRGSHYVIWFGRSYSSRDICFRTVNNWFDMVLVDEEKTGFLSENQDLRVFEHADKLFLWLFVCFV